MRAATGPKRWLQDHEAGSGPYQLVSFEAQQRYTIERFPDYYKGWEGQHIDTAIFRAIRSESTRRIALENGDADWIYLASADAFEAMRDVSGLTLNREPTLNQLYFAFNTEAEPLGDVRVRRALALAYDYEGPRRTSAARQCGRRARDASRRRQPATNLARRPPATTCKRPGACWPRPGIPKGASSSAWPLRAPPARQRSFCCCRPARPSSA